MIIWGVCLFLSVWLKLVNRYFSYLKLSLLFYLLNVWISLILNKGLSNTPFLDSSLYQLLKSESRRWRTWWGCLFSTGCNLRFGNPLRVWEHYSCLFLPQLSYISHFWKSFSSSICSIALGNLLRVPLLDGKFFFFGGVSLLPWDLI